MYSATLKCLKIAQNISCLDDIKKTIVYENLISNLIMIKDLESKLDDKTKKDLHFIKWEKFKHYDSKIISDYHETDHNTMFMIIKEELPQLQRKLEKVIFK